MQSSNKLFGFAAVLSLDDIVVREGECHPFQLEAGKKVCDFEQPNRSCIFEPIFAAGQPTWKVYQGAAQGIADHTTHTADGHFYGLDLAAAFGGQNNRGVFRQASVQAQAVDGTVYRCLHFSYLMANVHPNTTLSYTISSTRTGADQQQQTDLWSVGGSTLGLWFSRRVPLRTAPSITLSLSIRTLPGESGAETGMIFVDDIKFLKSDCLNPYSCDFEVRAKKVKKTKKSSTKHIYPFLFRPHRTATPAAWA